MIDGFIAHSPVGVAWAVHSQAIAATDELQDRVAQGSPLVVPTLWPFEVANSLPVLLRRKKILADRNSKLLIKAMIVAVIIGTRSIRESPNPSSPGSSDFYPDSLTAQALCLICGTVLILTSRLGYVIAHV